MINKAMRILAIPLGILLLQVGCASLRVAPESSADPAVESSLVVTQLVKSVQSWNGATLPAYPPGQPEITILRIRIPAGSRLDTHYHPVINAGVLVSGELTVVTTAGDTLQLEAGDPIIEVVKTLHYGINQGDAPADIIVFYAGIVGTPITVIEPE